MSVKNKVSLRKNKNITKLVDILQKESLIHVVAKKSGQFIVKTIAIRIKPIFELNIVKKEKQNDTNVDVHQLIFEASRTLPTVNGVILLSTKKGLLTHHQALAQGIGGTIFGAVY